MPAALQKLYREHDQLLQALSVAVAITPKNASEEHIGAVSARLLAKHPTTRVIRHLTLYVDRDSYKYASVIAISNSFTKPPLRLRFPCVDGLVEIGAPGIAEVITATVDAKSRTTLQIELTAYALLEMLESDGIRATREARRLIIERVWLASDKTQAQGDHRQETVKLLCKFLETIPLQYYRARRQGKEATEVQPPEASVLFNDSTKVDGR